MIIGGENKQLHHKGEMVHVIDQWLQPKLSIEVARQVYNQFKGDIEKQVYTVVFTIHNSGSFCELNLNSITSGDYKLDYGDEEPWRGR